MKINLLSTIVCLILLLGVAQAVGSFYVKSVPEFTQNDGKNPSIMYDSSQDKFWLSVLREDGLWMELSGPNGDISHFTKMANISKKFEDSVPGFDVGYGQVVPTSSDSVKYLGIGIEFGMKRVYSLLMNQTDITSGDFPKVGIPFYGTADMKGGSFMGHNKTIDFYFLDKGMTGTDMIAVTRSNDDGLTWTWVNSTEQYRFTQGVEKFGPPGFLHSPTTPAYASHELPNFYPVTPQSDKLWFWKPENDWDHLIFNKMEFITASVFNQSGYHLFGHATGASRGNVTYLIAELYCKAGIGACEIDKPVKLFMVEIKWPLDIGDIDPTMCPIKCPDGKCVNTALECTGGCNLPMISCPDGRCEWSSAACDYCVYNCSDGTCQSDFSMCACPPENPHKCDNGVCAPGPASCVACGSTEMTCWDNSCAATFNECPCAPGQIRCVSGQCTTDESLCTNSGENCAAPKILCQDLSCRDAYAECPCTPGYTKCQDGLCRVDCNNAQTCGSDQLVCWDGLCVTDYSMCSCPPSDPIRCASGRCALNASQCVDEHCDSNAPVLCWNSECVVDVSKCPCPQAFPVKCEATGHCATHVDNCTTGCASGYLRCWDNTCAASLSQCPCPPNAPIKCTDTNLCAVSAAECEKTDECNGVMCYDHSCVDAREECPCPPSYPYRCNGFCTDNVTLCTDLNNPATYCPDPAYPFPCWDGICVSDPFECQCPPEFPNKCPDSQMCVLNVTKECFSGNEKQCEGEKPVLCYDGVCAKNHSVCSCPFEKPVRCPKTNMCVQKQVDCPSFGMENLCPPDLPYYCGDYSCAKDAISCPANVQCPSNYILCPDKTCHRFYNECAVVPQCDSAMPYLCSDMKTCAVSVATCPSEVVCPEGDMTCPDGSCVSVGTSCPQITRSCEADGMVTCGDLTCVKTVSDCPQQKICPEGYVLCPDKSCMMTAAMCNDVAACQTGEIRCPSGMCTTDLNKCPSTVTCGEGYLKCWNGQCAKQESQCPPPQTMTCNAPLLICPDGISCVDDLSFCPTDVICPSSSPVKCSAGNCVLKKEDCPPEIDCPSSKPYLCGTICVAKMEECNFDSTCPSDKIKCWDKSCKTQVSECPPPETCQNGQIVCDDGKCAWSTADCSTPRICKPGTVLCADGITCVKNTTKCPPPQECSDPAFPTFCMAGLCVKSKADCPTETKCSGATPVKCDNGKCAVSIAQCSETSECPEGKFKCPNQLCVSNYTDCGTPVTCPESMPVKCLDSTCKPTKEQCPNLPPCDQFLCWDGQCKSSPEDCASEPTCPNDNPVRCPDQVTCVQQVSDCPVVSACPQSLPYMCPDGICVELQSHCIVPDCPAHLSYRCPGMSCRKDATDCPSGTGCPNGEQKCYDGSCRPVSESCDPEVPCDGGQNRCPDGSCQSNAADCPQTNGCPDATPFLCDNGYECVLENEKDKCTPAEFCPMNKNETYRCPDGICVRSPSECQVHDPDAFNCPNGVICASGECVSSSLECPTLPTCDGVRCNDGSCRATLTDCPTGTNCPELYQIICPSGLCVNKTGDCPTSNGCGADTPYKCNSGICVMTTADCDMANNQTLWNSNGCPRDKSVRCWTGECAVSESDCVNENGCPSTAGYRCPDSQCVASLSDCSNATACLEGFIKCANGDCKPNWDECNTPTGCPMDAPHRCMNSTCMKYAQDCAPVVVCPSDYPIMCADYSCKAKYDDCPPTKQLCDNLEHGICPYDAKCHTMDECMALSTKCPETAPIKCDLDGTCVSDGINCPVATPCPDQSKPFLCVNGYCVKSYIECQNTSSTCEEGSFKCSDGSCVKKQEDCLPLPPCPQEYPKRCTNGACVGHNDPCDPPSDDCVAPNIRCPSGVCIPTSKTCDPYYGCDPASPYPIQCPSGICVDSIEKCQGHCSDGQMECFNGDCVVNATDCQSSPHTQSMNPVTCSGSKNADMTASFGTSDGTQFMQLNVPAGAVHDGSQGAVDITVKSSPPSEWNNPSQLPSLWTNETDIIYYILSPVVSLQANGAQQPFEYNVVFSVVPYLTANMSYDDVVLGYYNTTDKKWYPASSTTRNSDGTLQGTCDHMTPFALIQRPEPADSTESPTPDENDDSATTQNSNNDPFSGYSTKVLGIPVTASNIIGTATVILLIVTIVISIYQLVRGDKTALIVIVVCFGAFLLERILSVGAALFTTQLVQTLSTYSLFIRSALIPLLFLASLEYFMRMKETENRGKYRILALLWTIAMIAPPFVAYFLGLCPMNQSVVDGVLTYTCSAAGVTAPMSIIIMAGSILTFLSILILGLIMKSLWLVIGGALSLGTLLIPASIIGYSAAAVGEAILVLMMSKAASVSVGKEGHPMSTKISVKSRSAYDVSHDIPV